MMLSFQHCSEPLKVGSYGFTMICVLENLPSGQHSYLPVFPGTPVWLIKGEDIEQSIGETSETEKRKRKRGDLLSRVPASHVKAWTTVYIQETVTFYP